MAACKGRFECFFTIENHYCLVHLREHEVHEGPQRTQRVRSFLIFVVCFVVLCSCLPVGKAFVPACGKGRLQASSTLGNVKWTATFPDRERAILSTFESSTLHFCHHVTINIFAVAIFYEYSTHRTTPALQINFYVWLPVPKATVAA